ncbi:catechol 2,3-dioxygenase-like lactoylglutathione lyase family enzyme [Sphingomonas naasensis]|uniref:VOC family protein n=1 Tax=Sphingomonas naasensis TaxID=1344951 RepID=A0A4S1WMZ9_9SPHN|nr:VOC family protein [Sphingomonas naasensis]NIJ20963.1 catechol 2,3-dioxygenase-like lactoylglutathione lyase family enzyme [Sphingomonas naasensis]TGX43347.1 VOC family protein [Sphingomonas naasensis]
MLKDKTSAAIVACSDIDAAKRFYTETLGLPLAADHGDVFTVTTGESLLNIYRSDFAGTNKANAAVWGAGGDVEAIAAELRGAGVTLDEYPDGFDAVRDGVHVKGDFRAIWFKDPDGNILHVNGGG